MSKPKKQSAAAQSFDRPTVKEALNSQFQNALTKATEQSNKASEKEIALRAALAVMREADACDQGRGNRCTNCGSNLHNFPHEPDCPRVSAIRLVREALGE